MLTTKRIILLLVMSLTSFQLLHGQSCCVKPKSNTGMAVFASNIAFQNAHAEPIPYDGEKHKGTMKGIVIDPAGTEMNCYLVESSGSNKYLIVVHEWWGLNDYVKQACDKYAGALPGVNILAVDLYKGAVTDNREAASELMQKVSNEEAYVSLQAVIYSLGEKAEIATTGWCFGGGWSLQASMIAGNNAKACVMYYGMPEEDNTKLKNLSAPVLGIFAKKDMWILPEMYKAFEYKLTKEMNKSMELIEFDAEHAFANPSNPNYDKEAAAAAYKREIAFLKEKLQVK
ncbi:MAG: dienelactone hydrolase family protein [Bacteroidetes bacterium]|nr:dienelactone hydrolase family protein [Bacteroidota bacterium]